MGDDGVEGGDEGESRTSENGEEGQIERVREPKTISVLVCVCVCACVSAHEHIYVQRGRNSRHTQFICFISHGIMSCRDNDSFMRPQNSWIQLQVGFLQTNISFYSRMYFVSFFFCSLLLTHVPRT